MTTSDRLKMPFLAAAQAQKEMTHNEALAILDIAVQPVVQAIAPPNVPAVPVTGQCWIVGTAPAGAWAGHPQTLAAWTEGGWRFVAPFEGMTVWSVADDLSATYSGAGWLIGQVRAEAVIIGGQKVIGARHAAIALPSGGTTNDAQSRIAIVTIIETLVSHGLIS